MVELQYEWDEEKRRTNIAKHRLDFFDASSVFDGQNIQWESFGYGGPRWIAVGLITNAAIAVVFTMRGQVVRIISVRRARKHEQQRYYKNFPL